MKIYPLLRVLLCAVLGTSGTSALAAADKPNILVIWGDDIGWSNISAYHRGMLGGSTPNIDRIANEGALFTDYYGEQSCTAGRSAFITGQHPLRTGLLKVGLPGADIGLQAEDPTIAELLKPLGYATGQFGKNHFGDLNEFLPTNHGFDEFFGNLYHLNAEGARLLSIEFIEMIDLFLLGTILLITSVGLFQLFIRPDIELPEWLVVANLEQLKFNLLAVIVVMLAILFLGEVAGRLGKSDESILDYGLAIAAVLAGVALVVWVFQRVLKQEEEHIHEILQDENEDQT
jgi:uncharacterized membrane protein YqhA